MEKVVQHARREKMVEAPNSVRSHVRAETVVTRIPTYFHNREDIIDASEGESLVGWLFPKSASVSNILTVWRWERM